MIPCRVLPTHGRLLSNRTSLAMASRILARSKALPLAAALTRAAADAAPALAGTRALSSLSRYPGAPSPHGLVKVRSSPRSPFCPVLHIRRSEWVIVIWGFRSTLALVSCTLGLIRCRVIDDLDRWGCLIQPSPFDSHLLCFGTGGGDFSCLLSPWGFTCMLGLRSRVPVD